MSDRFLNGGVKKAKRRWNSFKVYNVYISTYTFRNSCAFYLGVAFPPDRPCFFVHVLPSAGMPSVLRGEYDNGREKMRKFEEVKKRLKAIALTQIATFLFGRQRYIVCTDFIGPDFFFLSEE